MNQRAQQQQQQQRQQSDGKSATRASSTFHGRPAY